MKYVAKYILLNKYNKYKQKYRESRGDQIKNGAARNVLIFCALYFLQIL